MPRPIVSVRHALPAEEQEPCRNCHENDLPVIVMAGGMATYVFCPLCALEIAHDIIRTVKELR